ncbi:hypothetical protein HPP92_015938, partial [Vanilla planifolia]
ELPLLLKEALNTVQIHKEDIENAFAMLTAVLWFGNVKFQVVNSENHVQVIPDEGSFSMQNNSFEQLCINYANERLQQHFNRHLFKLEQEIKEMNNSLDLLFVDSYRGLESTPWEEKTRSLLDQTSLEYRQDGIDWSNIDFIDNMECLNLFEKDNSWQNLLAFKRIETKNAMLVCFWLVWEEWMVLYNTHGFLEKNRDTLYLDSVELLKSCSCQLLHLFASHILNQPQKLSGPQWLNGAYSQKHSLGLKFKVQLFRLMQHLENTTPHFITCIKPNNEQLPGMFENATVLEQLKCYGIPEVVRMSRSGYPTRITHQQFAERFGFLLLDVIDFQDPLSVAIAILQQFNVAPEMYQVGYTKLFFRTGQIAALEIARKNSIERIVWVQKHYRYLKARRRFQTLKQGTVTFQSFIRGYLARKRFSVLKSNGITNRSQDKINGTFDSCLQERMDTVKGHPQVQTLALEELQRRALCAEAALRQKQNECTTLQEQLQLSQTRCSENEMQMKSKEEMWQKQITSLQSNIASLRASRPGRHEASTAHHNHQNYDSEDSDSPAMHTPDTTPPRQIPVPTAAHVRDFNGHRDPVGLLAKEFDQQVQVLEKDAQHIGPSNPEEELRRLKVRFYSWKKGFKVRLREAKVALRKSGTSEGDKARKRWWMKKTIRI